MKIKRCLTLYTVITVEVTKIMVTTAKVETNDQKDSQRKWIIKLFEHLC